GVVGQPFVLRRGVTVPRVILGRFGVVGGHVHPLPGEPAAHTRCPAYPGGPARLGPPSAGYSVRDDTAARRLPWPRGIPAGPRYASRVRRTTSRPRSWCSTRVNRSPGWSGTRSSWPARSCGTRGATPAWAP